MKRKGGKSVIERGLDIEKKEMEKIEVEKKTKAQTDGKRSHYDCSYIKDITR